MRLNDKVAIVTGASRGIGKAIALAFASEGADVVVNYVNVGSNRKEAEDVGERIRSQGRHALVVEADVTSRESVEKMVNAAVSKFGRVDLMVNNAGITSRDYSIVDLKEAESTRVMGVNLNGPLNCIRAVTPHMMKRKYGKIINITSLAGFVLAGNMNLSYLASKSALIALTRQLAIVLGPHNININGIAPGTILTDIVFAGRTREETETFLELMKTKAALGRNGTSEDVANAALFLASDEANFITGQILPVDGGRMDFFSRP